MMVILSVIVFVALNENVVAVPSTQQQSMDNQTTIFELGKMVVHGGATNPMDSLSDDIDGMSLDSLEIANVATALNTLPGVTLTRFGPRNEEAVYVRGFDRREVSIYVDGVPVSVPYDGFADLARFTTMDIASISLSKGYGSVLSGANGFGGVVNIISSQTSKPFLMKVKTGVYSGNGKMGSLNVGGSEHKWFYQLGASYNEFDDFPLPDDFSSESGESDSRENAYEKDLKLSGKVGFRPNTDDEYVLGFVHQEAEKGTPSYVGTDPTTTVRYWQWPEWDKSTAYLTAKIQREKFYLHPRFFYDRYDNTLESYDDATYTTMKKGSSFIRIHDDYSYGGSVEGGTSGYDTFTIRSAIHYKVDHHTEHNLGSQYFVFEDSVWSGGLEMTLQLSEAWMLQSGVSYDYMDTNEAVDTNTGLPVEKSDFQALNPQIAAFFKVADYGSFHLGISKRSRFPTIKDRYSYKMGKAIFAPDLDPESVIHYELGYAGKFNESLWVSTALFYSTIDDLIESVAKVAFDEDNKALSQNQNIGKAEHSGFELALTYVLNKQLTVSGDYTYLNRDNIYAPELYPTYTPKHSGSVYFEYQPTDWLMLVPYVEYSDERYTSTDGTKVDGFTVVNVKAMIQCNEQCCLDFGVKNLTDTLYQFQEGYPEMGRSWFANVSYQF